MMDQENIKTFDDDLEEGELSDSDDGYTPLKRPRTQVVPSTEITPAVSAPEVAVKMEEAIDDSASESGGSSSTTSDSDDCLKLNPKSDTSKKPKQKKKTKRTVLIRDKAVGNLEEKKTRFKKYDIWATSLQEDTLTENMRGIDVAHDVRCDRSVESYDYTLKYRLNGENSLKRRLSASSDEHSENDFHQRAKRSRAGGVKSRIGQRPHRPSDSSSDINEPRTIQNLEEPVEGKPPQEIARDMAKKLYEEKDDLLVKVLEVVGPDIAIQTFKETQQIESEGGMMILTGNRRRTPGGVFLFLLKYHNRITPEQKKLIFSEEQRNVNKAQKEIQAIKRTIKVERLKKKLSAKEKNLPALASRKELYLGFELKAELQSTLSNPPPSPVGQEHSPEYKSHAINHVAGDVSPEKPCTSKNIAPDLEPVAYDGDFLDLHCNDMDFF